MNRCSICNNPEGTVTYEDSGFGGTRTAVFYRDSAKGGYSVHNDYAVMTCLSCKRRDLFEGPYGAAQVANREKKNCPCGSNERVIAYTNSYQAALRLSKTEMRPEFMLMHRVLLNKRKVLQLLNELVNSCAAEMTKAEILDEPQRLKSITRWLSAVTMHRVEEEIEDDTTKTAESIGEVEEQQVARITGVSRNVTEGGG
jgi:hypothetical protein